MLQVLWLCSWYPNNVLPFEGDFIQRHAQATSLHNKIHVIKLTPDPNAKNVTRVTRTYQQWPNLTETYIYYPKPKSIIGKAVAYMRWYSLYKFAIESYFAKNEKPDLVHVQIPFKAGIIAKQIKQKYKIPFVVTEHWGGYNRIVENNYWQREPWFKRVIKDTFKNASSLHSVSQFLADEINASVAQVSFKVIPNVVNTEYFNTGQHIESWGKLRLLHISSGVLVKNVPGIIDAFNQLDDNEYELTIVGLPTAENDEYKKRHQNIQFIGEVSYKEVAAYLGRADALIVFSFIENSPCVISEALCCGVPVVASAVGGIPELVDYTNGLLTEPGNVPALATSIKTFKDCIHQYDRKEIADKAQKRYSYAVIAAQMNEWYNTVLQQQLPE